MESLSILIRTLTPLWTGGISNTATRLHETGILGSLRWWYEVIERGLGRRVCDTIKQKCELSGVGLQRYKKVQQQGWWEALEKAGMCDVCKIFGTTGWRRQFDLVVLQDKTRLAWDDDITLNIRPPQRTRGWFLPAGRIGTFTLRIQGSAKVIERLAFLLLFLESWGALGAKNQLGYGFFKITNDEEVQKKAVPWFVIKENERFLPHLQDWLFFRFRFQPSRKDWWSRVEGLQRLMGNQKTAHILSTLAQEGMIPVSPVLKNWWRFKEWKASFFTKEWLLGTSKGEKRIRSKVAVSWAYRQGDEWIVRGWGRMIGPEERERDRTQTYQQDIRTLETLLREKTIWEKALHLHDASLTDLQLY